MIKNNLIGKTQEKKPNQRKNMHTKHEKMKSSVSSRKNSIFTLSSDVIPQTLIVNSEETVNPMLHSTPSARMANGRNRSDTTTTVLSNIGFQSIGHNRAIDSSIHSQQEDSRGTRTSISVNDNNRSSIYTVPTTGSSRKNIDIRSSNFLTPINSQRRSISSSRSSLNRSRSESSGLNLESDNFDGHSSITTPSKSSSSKKTHFYSKIFSRQTPSSKKSKSHQQPTSDDNAISSISKILHYPHHSNKYLNVHNNLGSSSSSVFEGSNFKRQVSNHVLQDLITQNETLTKNDLSYLYDLIQNLPSLETNFSYFLVEERERILQNTWHVYCNVCFSLFKKHKIWNLNNKIEDLNRILQFYIKMVQNDIRRATVSQASSSSHSLDSTVSNSANNSGDSFPLKTHAANPGIHMKASNHNSLAVVNKQAMTIFSDNLEDFFSSAIYVLENQIVFNYKDESVINNAIKRLCIIWKTFYDNIYHDVLILNSPFDTFFKDYCNRVNSQNPSGSNAIDINICVENIVLKCFRDSIILPYYQNFTHANEGGSASFMNFLHEQEDITHKDKLLLLQCLGILKTIESNDENQNIINELSNGLRMSMS